MSCYSSFSNIHVSVVLKVTFNIGLHAVGGRTCGRSRDYQFSRVCSGPFFLTHGAPLRARESSANNLEMKVIARAFAFRTISASEVRVCAESQYIYRSEIRLFFVYSLLSFLLVHVILWLVIFYASFRRRGKTLLRS